LPDKLSKALLEKLGMSDVKGSWLGLLQLKLKVKTIVVLYRFDQSCFFFKSFVNKLKKVQPSMLGVIVAEEEVHFFLNYIISMFMLRALACSVILCG
jgi:hypothetical protein